MPRKAWLLLAILIASSGCNSNQQNEIYIYAAISTSSVLNEFEERFEKSNPQIDLKINYAATSTLARQIDAGAPADLFISADTLWSTFLKERKFPNENSISLAENSLVLVTSLDDMPNTAEAIKKSRRISVAELEHVPAGRHAKNILECLELYEMVEDKMVPSMNVRVAFLNVKNQVIESGIVYRSEALNALNSNLKIHEFKEPCSPRATYELMVVGSKRRRALADLVVSSLQSLPNKKLWGEKNFY